MTKLEIERKFLVEPVVSWENLQSAAQMIDSIYNIEQTYLLNNDPDVKKRVRKMQSIYAETVKYFYNSKRKIENGVNEEDELEITSKEYDIYLQFEDLTKNRIYKTRITFTQYIDKYEYKYELDLFKNQLQGLSMLEIELKSKDDVISIPSFFKVIKEVTNEKKYSNYNLADKNPQV